MAKGVEVSDDHEGTSKKVVAVMVDGPDNGEGLKFGEKTFRGLEGEVCI